jgi:hypothetical protein
MPNHRIEWLAALSVLLLVGCASPAREWQEAQAKRTVEACDSFLARHPTGPLAKQAKLLKAELYFDRARGQATVAADEDFLRRYPSGALSDRARAGIEEVRFQKAAAGASVEAYEQFLQLHPNGAHAEEARKALDGMLPSAPTITAVEVVGMEASRCRVDVSVAVRHQAGKVTAAEPPAIEGDIIECGGMYFSGDAEVKSVTERDANHSIVSVQLFSWKPDFGGSYISGCSGDCELGFALLDQKQRVKVTFK